MNLIRPQTNVTVIASNAVSNFTITVPLFAVYSLNGISFTVNANRRMTTQNAHFELDINAAANIPMARVNITITLHDGNNPVNIIEDIQDTLPASLPYQYDVIYGTQGYYNATVVVESPVDYMVLYKYMRIWDKLNTVDLSCSHCPILITNTPMILEFTGVPRSGFEYVIDMGDGTTFQSENSSILYELYSLSTFAHTYTNSGYFNLQWTALNGGYSNNMASWIIVQYQVTDFQVQGQQKGRAFLIHTYCIFFTSINIYCFSFYFFFFHLMCLQ